MGLIVFQAQREGELKNLGVGQTRVGSTTLVPLKPPTICPEAAITALAPLLTH